MSSHWKFEVHVKTPGEEDGEEERVQQFADLVQSMADLLRCGDMKIDVTMVERN